MNMTTSLPSRDTPAPFSCTYTPNMAELLQQLNCTIAISTYQAGKLIFISAKDDEDLHQLPRNFPRAMGVAIHGDKMAIATQSEVVVLKDSKELARHYPKKPDVYDAYYLPMATYYTGNVDMHDIHFGKNGQIYAVNTAFSCICTIDEEFSFTPYWQPKFIDRLAGEDRCHLNGLAMEGDELVYISALGSGNTPQSWRDHITEGGVIIDIGSNEIVCEGLAMPHAPRIYDGKLFVLLSAGQKLIEVDRMNGQVTEVAHIPGFVRGMARTGDYLMIATSKLRQNSSTFKHLEVAKYANEASIVALHLPTGAIVGQITYQSSVDEIYDVQILEGVTKPNICNTMTDLHTKGLITPSATYWSVGR